MWVVILFIFIDNIHGVMSGIIRGLGLQLQGSNFTLFCNYIIGMPLALFLCFTQKMGIAGLWLGFSISTFVLDFGFFYIIANHDW
jgi:MATE family multidrug resistance protein